MARHLLQCSRVLICLLLHRCAPQELHAVTKLLAFSNFVESSDGISTLDCFGRRGIGLEYSPPVGGHLHLLSSPSPLARRCRCREPVSTKATRPLYRAKSKTSASYGLRSVYA